jgi:hypothetical protein
LAASTTKWNFNGRHFDISPDGEKFIMFQKPQILPEQQKIFVIQNFNEELKRLGPTGKSY